WACPWEGEVLNVCFCRSFSERSRCFGTKICGRSRSARRAADRSHDHEKHANNRLKGTATKGHNTANKTSNDNQPCHYKWRCYRMHASKKRAAHCAQVSGGTHAYIYIVVKLDGSRNPWSEGCS